MATRKPLVLVSGSVQEAPAGDVLSTGLTVSATAPSSPSNGMEWEDLNSGIRYTWIDDGTSTQWVELGPGGAGPAGGAGAGTVTSVSGTAPIGVATGTTTPAISISAATTSAAGSMSASDKTKLDGVATGATANAGTVTTASVVTANGISGSVATATTTPAITLTLGAITPSSVNGNTITTGSGTLTLNSGAALIVNGSTSLTLAGTGTSTMTLPPASASLGYLNVPQNSVSVGYTAVLADAGKHIYVPTGYGALVMTIPASTSVAFPIGTELTFVNDASGIMSIAIATDTLVLAGPGTTGTRSLAQYGVATALKVASTRWIIYGTGLT